MVYEENVQKWNKKEIIITPKLLFGLSFYLKFKSYFILRKKFNFCYQYGENYRF